MCHIQTNINEKVQKKVNATITARNLSYMLIHFNKFYCHPIIIFQRFDNFKTIFAGSLGNYWNV